jgi:hypothetical protein
MAGTLHIFRRLQVNGPDLYQVNYTIAGRSFAVVLNGRNQLRDFLEQDTALEPVLLTELWRQLDASGSGVVAGIFLSEHDTASLGMVELPSDF